MSRCEAMVLLEGGRKSMYVMCGEEDAHLHHKLTRARGGLLLDDVGETYHHMYLCAAHHKFAHDEGTGYTNGLLIRGSVTTVLSWPMYVGPDEYLSEHYGEQVAREG